MIGENPVQTEPNSHHVEEGMAHLDFVVAQDLFLNDLPGSSRTGSFPASSFAEKEGTFTNTERRVNRVRRAVPCPWNAREDFRIVVEMAEALGAGWPGLRDARGRVERVRRPVAALVGDSLRPDRGGRAPNACAPTGTTALRTCMRPALPPQRQGEVLPGVEYQPLIEQPDSEYPFVLSTGRTPPPLQLGHDDDARGR